jgi:hypothetical protein
MEVEEAERKRLEDADGQQGAVRDDRSDLCAARNDALDVVPGTLGLKDRDTRLTGALGNG